MPVDLSHSIMAGLVGSKCFVFWKAEKKWFGGVIDKFEPDGDEPPYHVQYDDGEDEWIHYPQSHVTLDQPPTPRSKAPKRTGGTPTKARSPQRQPKFEQQKKAPPTPPRSRPAVSAAAGAAPAASNTDQVADQIAYALTLNGATPGVKHSDPGMDKLWLDWAFLGIFAAGVVYFGHQGYEEHREMVHAYSGKALAFVQSLVSK